MLLFWQKSRECWLSVAGVAVLWALCSPTGLWSAESRVARASLYYREALQLLKDFRRVPTPELGLEQYLLVAKAFRKVYVVSPTSSHSDDSLLFEAGMYRDASVRFRSERRQDDALKTYRFLVHEYPHSKLKSRALEAIAEIDGPLEPQFDRHESSVAISPESPPFQRVISGKRIDTYDTISATEPPAFVPVPTLHAPDSLRGGHRTLFSVADVRFWSHENATRIVVDVDDQVRYRFKRLQNPDRLFVDLLRARVGPRFSQKRVTILPVRDNRVRQIRVAQNQRTTVRIVFDLDQSVRTDFQWLTNPQRLVVELQSGVERTLVTDQRQSAEDDNTLAVSAPVLRASVPISRSSTVVSRDASSAKLARRFVFEALPPNVPKLKSPPPKVAPPEILSLASFGSVRDFPVLTRVPKKKLEVLPFFEEVEASGSSLVPESATLDLVEPPRAASATSRGKRNMIRALGLKIGRVVIDPGHGGHDTGTVGKGGLKEKDLVVDVSRRLGELIEANLGADVIYTRSADRFVSLKERTKLANDSGADLFISVHANSSRLRSIRGVETYYLSFTTNSWALGVASRENAAAQRSIHELENLLSKIALTEKIEESREFASKVQKSLYGGLTRKTKGLSDRGVRKAPFMVLVGAKMPAVLAEIGFLSNPKDEKLLRASAYRQEIAKHLFDGVRGYANTLSKVKLAESTSATSSGLD